ncbi:MAG: sialate O-acetylesterase, partial [Balneolaceae bacterium]
MIPLFLLLALPVLALPALAQPKLPGILSDGMVLQRGQEVRMWGWDDPGSNIEVVFRQETYSNITDDSGRWVVTITSGEAGGPFEMEISSGNNAEPAIIRNILVGEVWVASGQSNMALSMDRVHADPSDRHAVADYPEIRHFEVPNHYDFQKPLEDVSGGQWVASSSNSIHQFSAAAHYFAIHLHEHLGVPVGIINASVGGTPVEAWMSEEALKAFPVHYEEAQRFKDDALIRRIEQEDRARITAWHEKATAQDTGYRASDAPWRAREVDESAWGTMSIPGYWPDNDDEPVPGVFWFRTEIEVPGPLAGQSALLELGRIVDADSTFINGVFVGRNTNRHPPRWYDVPEGLLEEGINTIAVRVVSQQGRGGFVPDKPYELRIAGETIDLRGSWRYHKGTSMPPLEGRTFVRRKPLGLFNAMIAPITDFGIRGAIWYQGESNTSRPEEYAKLFPAMIADWRNHWHLGNFPFLFVQLANYMESSDRPEDSNWARLREAQLKTLLVPETAMAVAIDIGEWNDVHPRNKWDIGDRLALAARHVAHGEDLVWSGPVYDGMAVTGDTVRLSFTHVGSGLKATGNDEGKVHHVAIAGEDRNFVWAEARIEGDELVVRSDHVPMPVAVRYAWADNPESANLYNREGLPASPFRTDVPDDKPSDRKRAGQLGVHVGMLQAGPLNMITDVPGVRVGHATRIEGDHIR